MGLFDSFEAEGSKDLESARKFLEVNGYLVVEPKEKWSTAFQGSLHKQRERQDVWVQAWCATANSTFCVNTETAEGFADACLKAFDKRFPPE